MLSTLALQYTQCQSAKRESQQSDQAHPNSAPRRAERSEGSANREDAHTSKSTCNPVSVKLISICLMLYSSTFVLG
jgi:hypothetical protein